ncbi:MAG TPA: tetratricopeptide repeat protein [Ignavibacteria bacterium]|nr:tetratricopeptide repeat protein [Ignavibacteria bacterium]
MKRRLLIALSLVFIVSASAFAQSNKEKGINAVKSGDYVSGVNLLKGVVTGDKGYEANYYYAKALMETGSLKEAEEYFNIALKDESDGVGAMIGLGEIAARKKDYAKAYSFFRRGAKEEPENIPVLLAWGRTYSKAGNIDSAIFILTRAKSINSKNADVYVALGDAYYYRRAYTASLDNYKEALKINSRSAAAEYGIGNVYYRQMLVENDKTGKISGQLFSQAAAQFDKAIQLDRNFSPAYFELGRLYYFNGDYDKAIENFKMYSTLTPGTSEGNGYYAKTLYSQKKYAEAMALVNDMLSKNPNDEIANKYKSFILIDEEVNKETPDVTKIKEGIALFNKVPVEYLDKEDYVKIAEAYIAIDDTQNGYKYYFSAITMDTTDSDKNEFLNMAITQITNKDFDNAMTNLAKAESFGEDDYRISYYKGYAYFDQKKFDESIAEFQKSIALNPNAISPQLLLAYAYAQLDKKEDAIREFKKVLVLDPDNSDALEALKILET